MPHVANGRTARQHRQDQAKVRAARHAQRVADGTQVQELDTRLGKGKGAAKERAKLSGGDGRR